MIRSPLAKKFFGSLGYQTPGNKLEFEYLLEFETEFKQKLGYESRFHMGSIQKKNWKAKISCYYPLKASFYFPEKQTVLKILFVAF
jgi:hypothetical protein